MTVHVLTVCGSLQQRSTNRAALDAASRFLFGRNEPAVQNYHNTIARLMAGATR